MVTRRRRRPSPPFLSDISPLLRRPSFSLRPPSRSPGNPGEPRRRSGEPSRSPLPFRLPLPFWPSCLRRGELDAGRRDSASARGGGCGISAADKRQVRRVGGSEVRQTPCTAGSTRTTVRGQIVRKTRLGDANGSDQRLGPRRTEVLIGIGNRIRMSMPLHDCKWLQ